MRKTALLRCFYFLSYVAAAAIVIFAWRVNDQNKRLRLEYAALLESTGLKTALRAPVIHGFEIPILDHVNISEDYRPVPAVPLKRLILVYNNDCGACKQQLPHWERFLSDARVTGIDTWLVASGASGPPPANLIDILRKRKMPYRLMQVKSMAPFLVATGLVAIPMTVVTKSSGQESVVQLVHTGVADENAMATILDLMNESTSGMTALLGRGSAEYLR